MATLKLILVLSFFALAGCTLARNLLTPDREDGSAPATRAAQDLAPALPVDWQENLPWALMLVQNAFLAGGKVREKLGRSS